MLNFPENVDSIKIRIIICLICQIPTACITVEDAELLWRMQSRGENITISLYMEAENHPPVTSYNTVAEIKGWKYPEQVRKLDRERDVFVSLCLKYVITQFDIKVFTLFDLLNSMLLGTLKKRFRDI